MKIVDLTCPFDMEYTVPQFPTVYHDLKIVHKYTMTRDGRYCSEFTLSTHTGTHIDFPFHVCTGGKKSGDYSIDDIYGETVTLDIPCGELYEISAE